MKGMADAKNQIGKIPSKIHDSTKDNQLLFVIVGLGIALVVLGVDPPYVEMLVAVGAAFIIAGGVGIYMMLATRDVAKKLHKRFNEQNEILESHTKIMNKMDDSLKDIASSQKDIASSQKDIASSQKDIASSQKDIASSQNQNHTEMIDVLKKIETGFSNLGEGLKRIENKL